MDEIHETRRLPLGLIFEKIVTDGQAYLLKTHLTPWKWWPFKRRLYLHVFVGPDGERVFHDHPFDFTTVVLWGGYDELSHVPGGGWVETVNGLQEAPSGRLKPDRLRWLSVRHRPALHAHRIVTLHRRVVVTLVIRGPKIREWGFWCPPVGYEDKTGFVGRSNVNNPSNQWVWVHWFKYNDGDYQS